MQAMAEVYNQKSNLGAERGLERYEYYLVISPAGITSLIIGTV